MRARAALAVAAAASILAVGCGNTDCPHESVDVVQNALPTCNGMAANASVTVSFPVCVRCNNATPVCNVQAEGGGYLLDPLAAACESGSSCPVPSCGVGQADRRTVSCTFTTPASGTVNVMVYDSGQSATVPVTFTLGGSNTSC